MLELSRVGKFMGSTDWDWESERFTLELCLFLLNSSEMKSCVAKTKTSNIRKRARDFRWLFVILNVEFIILSVITFLWMKSVFEKPRILCNVKNGTWSQATPLHSNNNAIRLKKKYRYLHWIRKQTFWSEFERKIELKGFEFKFGSLIHLKIYQHYQKPFEVVSTMYWSDWTGLCHTIYYNCLVFIGQTLSARWRRRRRLSKVHTINRYAWIMQTPMIFKIRIIFLSFSVSFCRFDRANANSLLQERRSMTVLTISDEFKC